MLFSLLPESVWLVAIVLLSLGVILRLVSVSTLFGVIGGIVLMALLGPFAGALFEVLPVWVSMAVLVVIILWLLRWFVALLFGGTVAAHFFALILHDIVLLPFRLIGMIFRRR